MLRRIRQAGRYLFGRSRFEREMRRELDAHLQMDIDHRLKAGAAPGDAERSARRDFGPVDRVAEEVRDARGINYWDHLVQDVRFGLRTLGRSPGYTFAAIGILALGIGANTAIFSVINGVLLKPLPFRDGRELVVFQHSAQASNITNAGVSIPELFEYRKRLSLVRDLVEYHGMSFTLLNEGEPDRVDTGVVSANFFEMLGINPLLGRTFVTTDDDLGADAVLVLSHEYWQSKFGGDPKVIGRVLQMNNRPHTVVGVLPDFPQYPRANDVYMSTSACPFRGGAQRQLEQLGFRAFASLRVFGRLSEDATVERAAAEIAGVASTYPKNYSADYEGLKGFTGTARSLQDQLVVQARPMLLALGGTVLLVLLIACANVANLSLARTARRGRELAVRTALGASRGRLFRQLVTESVIVAVAGGVLGLGLAALSLDLLVGFVGRFTPRTGQVAIDGGVLLFTLGVSLLTGILFGTAPALAARRRGLVQAVRAGSLQAGDSAGRQRLRSGLVVAQIAVSFMLVVGAALLLQSFHRLSTVKLGFDTDHVITANIFGNFSRQTTQASALQFQHDVLDRLRSSPGVRTAAITSSVPLSNIVPGIVTVQAEGVAAGATATFQVDPNTAGESYFDVLGVPILRGRDFRISDDPKAPGVAIINQTMARHWGDVDPIGQRFLPQFPPRRLPPGTPQPPPPWLTVIGVVPDIHLYSADRNAEAQYYTTFRQDGRGGQLVVASSGDPHELVPVIKAAVHGVDNQTPVEQFRTLAELESGQLAVPGLTAALLTIFAAVALIITLAGLAGVIGTAVSQRTREFGLRMALGASRRSVLQLVLGQGVILAVVGIVLGLGGAYAFSQLITGYLFATTPTDPVAYAIVGAVFVAATLLATFGPARRATSIDPLTALRNE